MSNLSNKTKNSLNDLFGMRSGYVLDFSNATFEEFIIDSIGINVYDDTGYEDYKSKAKKLRQIFEQESDMKVVKLIEDLLDRFDDIKLRNGDRLTPIEKKQLSQIRQELENLETSGDSIELSGSLEEKIKHISTRSAKFYEMSQDEKLKELVNLFEYMLKEDNKYRLINIENYSFNLIDFETFKAFKKRLQAFRHSNLNALEQRKNYSDEEKKFLIDYGIVLCNAIYREIEDNIQ